MNSSNPLAPPRRTHSRLAAHIGLARVDVTPPVGIYARNWGAARHDVATSIHRPLTLTALTIASTADSPPLILIDADLGWWKTPQVFAKLQQQLLAAASVDASQLIFALSHTHAGPPLMEPDSSLAGSQWIAPWMENVLEKAIEAMGQARAGATEAILEWHSGHCGLAAYRDLPEPVANSRRIVCGFNPDGRADDTLLVGRVSDLKGRVLATLSNYACHPTTLAWDNTAISPDYLGAFRETMEQATGAPAIFLQGASGELSPREQYVGDVEVADRHGRQLAHATLATLYDMERPAHDFVYSHVVESGAPLAVWTQQSCDPGSLPRIVRGMVRSVDLPIKDWPSADQLEHERSVCTDRALEERLRRKRDIRRALGDGKHFSLPIWAWRLGEAYLVGCCAEAYSQLQVELRRRFQPRSVICMNLINGSIGYLPPQPLYDQDIYQVWQTPFDRGSLERVVSAMAEAIEALSQDAAPVRSELR